MDDTCRTWSNSTLLRLLLSAVITLAVLNVYMPNAGNTRPLRVILSAVITFAVLNLYMPHAGHTRPLGYRDPQDIYGDLGVDKLPFEVVTPNVPKPKNHVAFLKVHKSGSTTAQNILLRYGWGINLTFVLPPAKNPFKYPNIISLRESLHINNTLPPPSGKHYEILCNHVIYERGAFRKYMPNDTFYVGIIREPYEMFKSTLNYLRPGYIYNKIKTQIPASEYLKEPVKYEPALPVASFTNNRIAVEFGCPKELLTTFNKDMLIQFIKDISADFGLVIVTEMFDESIILLRRYLNWSTKDILFLDKNVAKHKNDTALVGPFDRQMYKKWAKVDYALYEHFFRRLREQIRAEGFDFDDELLHFHEVRKMATEFCKGSKTLKDTKLVVQKSKWGDRFELTKEDCILLQKPEIQFIQDIRERQYGSRDI